MENCFYDIGFLLLYLFSCVGLSCSMWDLGCGTQNLLLWCTLLQLRHEGSRVCGAKSLRRLGLAALQHMGS